MSRRARTSATMPHITMPRRSPSFSGPSMTTATMSGSATWKAVDMIEVITITVMWRLYGRRYGRVRHKARRLSPPRRIHPASLTGHPRPKPIQARPSGVERPDRVVAHRAEVAAGADDLDGLAV